VRTVAIDPQEVFWVMQCAYRNGVLDKFMSIQGKALELVMEETGADMGDLLNRMDEAKEETVMKVDRLLDRVGPLLKYLNNDRLMRLADRLLSIKRVQDLMARRMADSIKRTLTGEGKPTLRERVLSLSGRWKKAA
jgi:hypothetical protein